MAVLDSIWSYITEPSMFQSIMVFLLVSGVGMYLGKKKIAGISFGLSFVFFVGIIVSHFGIVVDETTVNFMMNFGLVLFVYTLGLQVGPGFIASFKKNGLLLNIYAMTLILLGMICLIVMVYSTGETIPNLMGVLSGGVTNMPALGAAQDAVSSVLSHGGGSRDSGVVAEMAMATAVTYPFGVIGVFLVITLLRKLVPSHMMYGKDDQPQTTSGEFIVCNEEIFEMPIRETVSRIPTRILISQIFRDGAFILPKSGTILKEGDHVLVVYDETHNSTVHELFGTAKQPVRDEEMTDWTHAEDDLSSRRILITQSQYNGVRLDSLKLRNSMDINVTSVSRAGIDLLPSPGLHLQLGDRLSVVGKARDLSKLSAMMGNELKKLDTPYLVSLCLGMFIGCVIGAIPIYIPGIATPIKMGIAGGPLIVGIIMGAYGPRLHLTTYITQSANLMVRTLGLVWFMGALGLSSGAKFVETLVNGPGVYWMFLGSIITLLPTLIIGFSCIWLFKLPFSHTAGVLCGSMANPVALDYVSSITKGDTTAVAYVTVYPLTMVIRVILAQLTVGILMG